VAESLSFPAVDGDEPHGYRGDDRIVDSRDQRRLMIGRILAIVIDPSPTLHDALGWPPLVWAMRIGVMIALLVAAFVIVRAVAARVPRPHPSSDLPPKPSTGWRGRGAIEDGDATLLAASRLAEVSHRIDHLLMHVGQLSTEDVPPGDASPDDAGRTA